ncbi:hypothetical protein BJ742DRAFT_896751 [Cladochytrium replicatum]|nr:hypothetical protein BJ742DRAFT_896751 [Cladochytrium replicatum]
MAGHQTRNDSEGKSSSSSTRRPHLEKLETFLNQRIRVSVSDGRSFTGSFAGVDPSKNVLMTNTEERKGDDTRYVGLIMIPGKHLVRMEAEMIDEDEYA